MEVTFSKLCIAFAEKFKDKEHVCSLSNLKLVGVQRKHQWVKWHFKAISSH